MSLCVLTYFSVRNVCKRHRYTSFFNKFTAADLWKGCTSSSAIAKRRGKALIRARKDLNRGQFIAQGRFINAIFPGLNAPVTPEGVKYRNPKVEEPKAELEDQLVKIRDAMSKRTRQKVHPLERGWSGIRVEGKKLGPPDPVGDQKFEGFESMVLEYKMVGHMTAAYGAVRQLSALVAVGNGNGLIGFAHAKSTDGKVAINNARNAAARRLQYVERLENHTIYQDFFAECGRTHIFAKRMPEGTGLHCHRIIAAVCELIGIKNIYAKVENTTNPQRLIKAFVCGLQNQENFQTLADKKRLHVVEFRKEEGYRPVVKASPQNQPVRKPDEIPPDEVLDVEELYGEGRQPWYNEKPLPFYHNFPGHLYKQWVNHRFRNFDKVRLRLIAEGYVPNWSLEHRKAWTKSQEELVEKGLKLLPEGICLPDVLPKKQDN